MYIAKVEQGIWLQVKLDKTIGTIHIKLFHNSIKMEFCLFRLVTVIVQVIIRYTSLERKTTEFIPLFQGKSSFPLFK